MGEWLIVPTNSAKSMLIAILLASATYALHTLCRVARHWVAGPATG
jgi:hypothetical protein